MSKALWCDPGNHAFSARDPYKKHSIIQEEVPDGQYGEFKLLTEEVDICGPHVKAAGLKSRRDMYSGPPEPLQLSTERETTLRGKKIVDAEDVGEHLI